MNTVQTTIDHIIEALYPTPAEYMDNDRFMHLCEYAVELDEIAFIHGREPEKLVEYINKRLDKFFSTSPEYEACCDVATTCESLVPSLKDCFKY